MMKKTHIFILSALVIVVGLICVAGFMRGKSKTHNTNENQGTSASIQQNESIAYAPKAGEEWKADVAKRLYKEFCKFYDNMYNDDFISADTKGDYYGYEQAENNGRTGYSRFMASDRLTGILNVYGAYLTKDELDYVKSKKNEVYEYSSAASLVKSAYSESGLHVITVEGVTSNAVESGKFLANQIRGKSDENDFLESVFLETNYSMLDIFVEDLSPNGNDICIEPLLAEQNGQTEVKIEREKTVDNECEPFLKKYNRECVTDETVKLKNGSWNLFCFKADINDYIIIKTADEELKL